MTSTETKTCEKRVFKFTIFIKTWTIGLDVKFALTQGHETFFLKKRCFQRKEIIALQMRGYLQ